MVHPAGDDAPGCETWIAEEVLPVVLDTANVAVATGPLGMTLLFIPERRHTRRPAEGRSHSRDLPAEAPLEPSVMVAPLKSVAEYDTVHCNAAGVAPAEVDSERGREMDAPGEDEPDAKAREAVCAKLIPTQNTSREVVRMTLGGIWFGTLCLTAKLPLHVFHRLEDRPRRRRGQLAGQGTLPGASVFFCP